MADFNEEIDWRYLGLDPGNSMRETVIFTLFKIMDETRLLKMRISKRKIQEILRPGIIQCIRNMPSDIQELMLRSPEKCLISLTRLAQIYKKNSTRLWRYYHETATCMLHNEEVILVAPDCSKSTGIYLSDFLTRRHGLYRDDTIDERHLDYQLFVDKLVEFCGYDPSIHDISLWHEEPESQLRPYDANAVKDYESWISAMIEEQNALQDSKTPLVFHVAELNSIVSPRPI